MKKRFLFLALASLSPVAQAQFFTLPQLPNTDEVRKVANVLSSVLLVRTLETASEPGRFGFGLGVAASANTYSQISNLVGPTSIPVAPGGNIYATLYGPLGLALDVGALPPLSVSGVNLFNAGGNLRWTFTRLLGDWFPVNIAVGLNLTSSTIRYNQLVNSVNVEVNSSSTQLGLEAIVSKQLVFFEPYLALGLLNQSTTISSSGSQSIFTFSTAPVNVAQMSPHIRAGFQLKFFVVVLGAEYEFAHFNHTGAAKLGIKI